MGRKVKDLIKDASKGKRLPQKIIVKGDPAIWVRFGANFYDGRRNLAELIAFNSTWLNTEVEVIMEA